MKNPIRSVALFVLLSGTQVCLAQDPPAGGSRSEEFSKQASNPLADLMSFPFQNNLNMNYGEFKRNVNVMNFQPVIPFGMKKGTVITRTILPIVKIPEFGEETGTYSSGLSDVVFTAFYSPGSKTTWGFGPVLEAPTGGSERGHRNGAQDLRSWSLFNPGTGPSERW